MLRGRRRLLQKPLPLSPLQKLLPLKLDPSPHG
jgi:hypothetical protein